MVETIDSLIEGLPGASERDCLAAVQEALVERVERRKDLAQDSGEPGPDLQGVGGHLVGGLRKTAGWKLHSDGFDAIASGLRKTYSRNRSGCERAYVECSAAAFHEWRKRVKYHWYHVRLLRNLWPELMAARQSELKRLADLLGNDHDLQVVEQHLVTEQANSVDPGTLAKALTALRFRSTELRKEAVPLGAKLFAEKPKRFVQRVGWLWIAETAQPVALAAGSR